MFKKNQQSVPLLFVVFDFIWKKLVHVGHSSLVKKLSVTIMLRRNVFAFLRTVKFINNYPEIITSSIPIHAPLGNTFICVGFVA